MPMRRCLLHQLHARLHTSRFDLTFFLILFPMALNAQLYSRFRQQLRGKSREECKLENFHLSTEGLLSQNTLRSNKLDL